MLLASINLNKRLGADGPDGARARFAAWLRAHDVAVIVAQEPYKPADRRPPLLHGYVFAGGDGHLATWVREDITAPAVSAPTAWAQRVELGWLTVLQVHLDAYTSGARTAQLGELAAMASAEGGRPLLICGDFNLAPRPQDGLYDGEVSGFTADTERKALQHLLQSAWLVDTTRPDGEDEAKFTFERHFTGKLSRFRCDLALLSDHLAAGVSVTTRDEVRTGPGAFTDHSALLLDLPLTPEAAEPDDVLFAISDLTGKQPHGRGCAPVPAPQDRDEPPRSLTGGPGSNRTPDGPARRPYGPGPRLRPRGRRSPLPGCRAGRGRVRPARGVRLAPPGAGGL